MSDGQDEVPGVQPAVTVGRVVAMDETQVTVAADVFHDGVFRRAQTIPRKMVVRIVPLRPVGARGPLRVPEFVP
jgi:hypothetical protein